MVHELFIGNIIPPGWGDDYPICSVSSQLELRDFVSTYFRIKTNFKIGLDLRGVDSRAFPALLKLMEDSNLVMVLRANEVVPPTILSRCSKVVKQVKLEEKPLLDCFIDEGSIVGLKIKNLT